MKQAFVKVILKCIKGSGKQAVADPLFYLNTIEALIPKSSKSIIVTEQGAKS